MRLFRRDRRGRLGPGSTAISRLRRRYWWLIPALLGLGSSARAREGPPGLRVPPGFEIGEYADGRLANDIIRMTLDPRGRVVVSGPGYIRTLIDDDRDGRADRAADFAREPRDGAMGMLWEGDSFYFIGDGGLRRLRDSDGDGRADGPSELIRALRADGEHDAHALRRGPDGWLYLLCGNNAGVDASFARSPTSPIKEPVAGCVLRFRPDLKASEVVADGFRNPYGMDFNPDGALFTFDSDNERCVSLPWYEPTRFYHVIPGGHHGWLSPQRAKFWPTPPYAADVVSPVLTLGRGSPTGVACYRHTQFPAPYRGGFFVLDWTFGRVDFLAISPSGSTYTARRQVFLESVGDSGFAPTDLVVHPDTGDLYISIGGRGTRGAVYRVRYAGAKPPIASEDMTALGVRPRPVDVQPDWPSRAVGTDVSGRLEALVGLACYCNRFGTEALGDAVRSNWDHPDRYLRKAAADLISVLDDGGRSTLGRQARTPFQQTTYGLGSFAADPADALRRASQVLDSEDAPPEARLAGVRVIQCALGDLVSPKLRDTVWEGYSPRGALPRKISPECLSRTVAALRGSFPSGLADLDREITRTLAMLEDDDPATLARVADRLTATSHPVEDTHYLIVLARLRAKRPPALTPRTASTLLGLDRKLAAIGARRDYHWPLRIAELHGELARKDPNLNAAMLSNAEFGRPDHALFTQAPGFDRRRAAEVILARVEADEDSLWSPSLIDLVGELPDDRSLPVLRRLWGRAGLDDAIVSRLARHPRPEDRGKFLEGLASPQPATFRLCLDALEKLPRKDDGDEVVALIRALGLLPKGPENDSLRDRIARALRRITLEGGIGADERAWATWLTRRRPDLAARLGGPDGVDRAAWDRRLAGFDWSAGDSARGRGVFTRAGCAACHSGGQALGPDLSGVAGRFSRDDLFTAILQPSRDVSPRYRATLIATTDGQVYQGMIVYESVDGLILQTGAATTARVAGSQVTARRTTPTSLMPVGLLDKLTDREIADLYAYLKGLGRNPASGL